MKTVLILDAGHGSIDPQGNYTTLGKFFVHQQGRFHRGLTFYEGVFNRQVADKIALLCKEQELVCRKIYHDFLDTTLRQRTQLANQIAREAQGKAILMSVHGNASGNLTARGISAHIFTSASTASIQLGNALGERLAQVSKGFQTPFRKQVANALFWRDNFAMVREVACPAVLTENGFFTNRQDATLMMQDDFQYAIAQAHVNAFLTLCS